VITWDSKWDGFLWSSHNGKRHVGEMPGQPDADILCSTETMFVLVVCDTVIIRVFWAGQSDGEVWSTEWKIYGLLYVIQRRYQLKGYQLIDRYSQVKEKWVATNPSAGCMRERFRGVTIPAFSCAALYKYSCYAWGARIDQLVKAWICNLKIAGSSPIAGGVFFWYGPLANLSLQIASVGSDHHAKKWRSQSVD